jgi:transposase
MLSVPEQLTVLYVFVADFLQQHPALAQWRHSNHSPKLTDAEVITSALMQGYFNCFNCPTLKRTYLLVIANDPRAFPALCSYKQWVARLQAVTPVVGRLIESVPASVAETDGFYLIDSEPIPLCHPVRHGRVRNLREDGAWFGKTKKGWFFGFKLHLLVAGRGLILAAILTPGNWDDRDPVCALLQATEVGGACLGDLGDRGPALQDELWTDMEVLLLARADAEREQQALLSSVREPIETTFSQLWTRFATRSYARSWNGLWTALKLKMLELNLCHAGIVSY